MPEKGEVYICYPDMTENEATVLLLLNTIMRVPVSMPCLEYPRL